MQLWIMWIKKKDQMQHSRKSGFLCPPFSIFNSPISRTYVCTDIFLLFELVLLKLLKNTSHLFSIQLRDMKKFFQFLPPIRWIFLNPFPIYIYPPGIPYFSLWYVPGYTQLRNKMWITWKIPYHARIVFPQMVDLSMKSTIGAYRMIPPSEKADSMSYPHGKGMEMNRCNERNSFGYGI